MKKIIKLSNIFLAILLFVTGCNIDDKFQDPDSTVEGSVSGFYAAMINNERMRSEYWHVRTFIAEQTGRYTQTMILGSDQSIYRQRDSYIGDFWRDFYIGRTAGDGTGGVLAMYTLMNIQNEKDSPAQQANNKYFLNAAQVVLYDRGSQMIDLFGNIPFHTAVSLITDGLNTDAEFEDQATLYKEMIEKLATNAEFFKTAPTNTLFSNRDMFLAGDVNRWCRYANSIRLKMLLHMADADPAYAQPKIMEIVNNPSKYPLMDGDNDPAYKPGTTDAVLSPLSTYRETLGQALREGNSAAAPDFLVNDVMVPVNDPRLPIMFNKNKLGEFVAANITTNSEALSSLISDTLVSTWDSTTYWFNNKLPGIRLTAAEVNFIKAEAFERWGDKGAAKQAYEIAIRQSVTFYWYLYSINPVKGKEIEPSYSTVTDFISRIAYTSDQTENLKLIATQKWLHLGWLQSIEAWTEYRRTKLPVLLPFPSEGKLSGYETPPVRLTYPSVETNVNKNYAKIKDKDTRTTKIFWDVR